MDHAASAARSRPDPLQRVQREVERKERAARFAARLVAWAARCGRHALPWQSPPGDPYRVWLSEIMLQQTQVATVIPYFQRWTARWPTVASLAAAPLDEVMRHWAGLGYYARARNLHACARHVVQDLGGRFPSTAAALQALPGIGPSTAAAIASLCHGERAAVLDGNVRRVLARHAGVDLVPGSARERRLLELAQSRLPARARMPAYTQAVMDLGSLVCTARAPRCGECPVASDCVARRDGSVAALPRRRARGSARERHVHMLVALARGRVLLEQRPARGIWGGLLALPQFDDPRELAAAAGRLRARAGRAAGAPAPLAPLAPVRHPFTHYTLVFTPQVLRLAQRPPAKPGETWLPLSDAATAALPAPLRRLLVGLPCPGRARAGAGGGRRVAAGAPTVT